jgi:aspartate aminotransferase
MPDGAFYHFPDMRAFIGKSYGGVEIDGDGALAQLLLSEGHVATVAGSSFGAPGFLRFSFATSLDLIDEGMRRVKKLLLEIN